MQLRRRFPSLSAITPKGPSLALGFLDIPSQTEFTVTVHLSAPSNTAVHQLRGRVVLSRPGRFWSCPGCQRVPSMGLR